MWGSSNPGNEDSWWYEALQQAHRYSRNTKAITPSIHDTNWTYYEQPSGFAPDAENLANLPGGRAYYTALAKDKAEHWVKQFIEVEWGYSISGTPVIATFNADLHVAKKPLVPNVHLPLVGGFDPGMNSAMIFGQMDLHGRLLVYDELVQRDMGAQRFITNRVQPLMRVKYRDYNFTVSPDPASSQRTQTDERTVLQTISKHFKVKIADSNNRLPGRIEAIEHFTTRLTDIGPALLIDPACKVLIRALRSGWRYNKTQKGDTAPEPAKNDYSHPGDGFSYLCKFFYKGIQSESKRKLLPTAQRRVVNTYNMR